MKVKKKYAAVDIAKYVSAMLVVCVHTYPLYEVSPLLNTYWIQTVCRFAVPFFFTISAYFFFRKWNENSEEENKENLKRYLMRLGKIYLIWTVIYFPYVIWDYSHAGFSLLNVISYLRDFLLNGSYYHLWFLPALMLGTVIVSFIYQKRGLVDTLKVGIITYIIGYFINVYTPVWDTLPVISFLFAFFTKVFTTARNGIFFAPMFISIGLLLSKTKRLPAKTSFLGFLISFVVLVLEVTLYNLFGILRDLTSMYITLVPATYFFVSWLLVVKMPYKEKYMVLRNESLLIYTSHILFAKILLNLFPNAHIVVYFVTLALSQAFATIVIRSKVKFPILENLV